MPKIDGMPFIFLLLASFLFSFPAMAGMAEAKDLARNSNCPVTAIKLVSQDTGSDNSSTYQITCLISGDASEEQKKANGTIFVQCSDALCSILKKGE